MNVTLNGVVYRMDTTLTYIVLYARGHADIILYY